MPDFDVYSNRQRFLGRLVGLADLNAAVTEADNEFSPVLGRGLHMTADAETDGGLFVREIPPAR